MPATGDGDGASAGDEDVETALQFFEELPPGDQEEELRADLLYTLGRREDAVRIWDDLLQTSPGPGIVARRARAFLDEKDFAQAEKFLSAQREEGLLDEEGYRMLADLLLGRDAFEEALAVYGEARELDYYDDQAKLEHALAHVIALLPLGGRSPSWNR